MRNVAQIAQQKVLDNFDPSELIEEKNIGSVYPGLFVEGELAQLRKDKKIGHIPISRQRIYYRPVDIENYLRERFIPPAPESSEEGPKPCPKSEGPASLNTAGNGSDKSQVEPDGIDTGTKAAEQSAALSLL